MIRKAVVLGILALIGTVGWAGHSWSARGSDPAGLPQANASALVHVVIFQLKKDAPEGEADALIADANEMLRSIPTVRELRVGKPADVTRTAPGKREFSVGLEILFDDRDGLKTYSDHPMHMKYAQKHLPYVDTDKLMVFDFITQKR